jgi:hypothetical protein
MALRLHFENSNEIGVFAMLTNAYCLCAVGTSENFVRALVMRSEAFGAAALLSRCRQKRSTRAQGERGANSAS